MAQTRSAGESSPKTAEDRRRSKERVDELDRAVSAISSACAELRPRASARGEGSPRTSDRRREGRLSLKSADGKYTLKTAAMPRRTALLSQRRRQGDRQQLLPPAGPPDSRGERRPLLDFRSCPTSPRARRPCSTPIGRKFRPSSPFGRASPRRRSCFERLQSATDITFRERGLRPNLAPNRDVGLSVAETSPGVRSPTRSVSSTACPTSGTATPTYRLQGRRGSRVPSAVRRGTLRALTSVSPAAPATSSARPRPPRRRHGLPGYRSRSQQTVFRYRTDATTPANSVIADGGRSRVSPQAYVGLGSLGVLGECIVSSQEISLGTSIASSATARGGRARLLPHRRAGRFRSPTPKKPFDLRRETWGASRSRPATASSTSTTTPSPSSPIRPAAARRRRSGSASTGI